MRTALAALLLVATGCVHLGPPPVGQQARGGSGSTHGFSCAEQCEATQERCLDDARSRLDRDRYVAAQGRTPYTDSVDARARREQEARRREEQARVTFDRDSSTCRSEAQRCRSQCR